MNTIVTPSIIVSGHDAACQDNIHERVGERPGMISEYTEATTMTCISSNPKK